VQRWNAGDAVASSECDLRHRRAADAVQNFALIYAGRKESTPKSVVHIKPGGYTKTTRYYADSEDHSMRAFVFFPHTRPLRRTFDRAMRLGAIWLSIILGLVPTSSNASPGVSLPGAVTKDDIEVFDAVGNLLGDFGCGDAPGCSGLRSFSDYGASATVGGDPPFSKSSGSSASDSLFVNSTLTYSVEVVGPAQTVSLDFAAVAEGSSSGGSFAYADTVGQLLFADGSSQVFGKTCTVTLYCLPVGSALVDNGGINGAVLASTYTPFGVALTTQIHATPGGSSSAFIDPYFSIDPSVPDPQDYRILVSAGVENIGPAGGVPEMPAWTMMLLGFAGLGFAGYRRARAGHATRAD
jgi:hypothetical protein